MGLDIELEEVRKIYNQGRANEVTALLSVSLRIAAGSMVCLRGPSGSGKSTLLSIIGCVFPPSSGRAVIGGRQISRLPDHFLGRYRRELIGFIFQRFNILPQLTVLENITLPLLPLGIPPKERQQRAAPLLEKFGIGHRVNFPAGQISGGELQRVAIARALINDPPYLLADEPTAHLDSHLSMEFMDMVSTLKRAGKTVVLTSHDPLVSDHAEIDRIIDIRDGRLV
ncbi:MAG: ABC transporter ATP-binding protein [Deltaproteobacteria bacterium]|nr:ABC transporter ATP-binding protein [Deltaproteobacteria bacterium]